MLLLDVLVRSHLIFGAPVWATKILQLIGAGRGGAFGKLCTLYRSAQRTLLGLDRRVPNDLLAAIAVRPPLEVFLKKQVVRYFRALEAGRLAHTVMTGLREAGAAEGVYTMLAG